MVVVVLKSRREHCDAKMTLKKFFLMEMYSLQYKDADLTSYRKVIQSPIKNYIWFKSLACGFKAYGLFNLSNEKVWVKSQIVAMKSGYYCPN